MERTSKEEVNIPSIKEIRLERRRLARQNRKRRIFFNTTITWDGTNRTGVLTRACLKNKSCTKHIFPRPFS